MKLIVSFWAESEDEARAAAVAWADAEPNVSACHVLTAQGDGLRWTLEVELTMHEKSEQTTWLAA